MSASLSPIKVSELSQAPKKWDEATSSTTSDQNATLSDVALGELATARSVEEPFVPLDITRHTPQCIHKFNSIEAISASGCWVKSVENRKYLDLSSGIGVLSTGHCHPRVVQAAQEQCATMIFAQQNCINTTSNHKDLISRMLEIMPNFGTQPKLDSFFFVNSGAEAVENAVKVARMATGKQNVIVLTGGYHGRTYGSMACTSSKTSYRRCFGPVMGGVHFVDFDIDEVNHNPKYAEKLIKNFERVLTQQSDTLETACVLLEPILGEGGIVQVPLDFMKYLRRKCTDENIMLIFDEVQSGFGRSGKWFACEHAKVTPDILVYAKGIASGFPLGGIAANQNAVMSKLLPNALGGTFGGSAVAVAAANATIDVIRDENLLENADRVGAIIVDGLKKINEKTKRKDGTTFFTHFRQYGLFIAADLNFATSGALIKRAEKKEMILIGGGKNGIRISPPLVMSAQEAYVFLERIEECVNELTSESVVSSS